MVILLIMLLIITEVIDTAQRTWRQASSRLSQFREARSAFDTITRNLAQATLEPYRAFDWKNGLGPGYTTDLLLPPKDFTRTSDLGFIMGNAADLFTGLSLSSTDLPGHGVLFQAPLGYTSEPAFRQLNHLLCARGYFVRFGTDQNYIPQGLAPRLEYKSRFRLWEYQPTTETNTVLFSAGDHTIPRDQWATTVLTKSQIENNSRPLAENILSLVLVPSFAGNSGASSTGTTTGVVKVGATDLPLHTAFNSYTDTVAKDQLPSSVQVIMVAIDEASAVKLQQQFGSNAPKLYAAGFLTPSRLADDLRIVRESLLKLKVNFRVFSTAVTIPSADN